MTVERLLQIHIAALTTLGTLLLGMGEHNAVLPVLAVIVACSSVYLTDMRGWLQLNTLAANFAGLIALIVTVRHWNGYAAESQLLALANLLIYLQFVLHYRKKNVRNYWLLLLLSLLQVAVASALNLNIVFGALLPLYLVVGLATMSLFVLHRDQSKYVEPALAPAAVPPLPASADVAQPPPAVLRRLRRLHRLRQRTPGPQPEAAVPHEFVPAAGDEAPHTECRRWPLADRPASFSGLQPAGSIESGLTVGFARQIIWIAVATMLLASVWFVCLPRLGKKAAWRPRGASAYSTIGFTENVTLGELGEVSENPEEVMQVRFFDFIGGKEGAAYRVAGDAALFRGGALERYRRGEWLRLGQGHDPVRLMDPLSADSLPQETQLVKESISLRPRTDPVVFSVMPAYQAGQSGLRCSTETSQITRQRGEVDRRGDYELITTGFRDHVPLRSIAAAKRPDPPHLREMTQLPRRTAQHDPLAGLRQEAEAVAGHLPPGQRVQVASLLEAHLRDSGLFQYSLKPVARDARLDPIEDFITLHRSGHCEYFASALTMMLRSRGVPARLAIGYKGGQWNSAGRFYTVQELHAHAWVEVYLGPDGLPTSLRDDPQARRNGAWLILDPTPGSLEADRLAGVFGGYTLRQLLDLTQFVWTTYVLGLDSKRQQEAIFQPLVERIEQTLRDLGDTEQRRLLAERLGQLLSDQYAATRQGGSFGLLLAMVALLMLVVMYVILRPLARVLVRWWGRRAGKRRTSSRRVEFFEQFEKLLARHGMRRQPHQTQREFALASGGQLAETPATRPVAALPRRIAELYYHVRFGGRDLDNAELQAVQQALSTLADALRAHASGFNMRKH
ncbi:MAG TPA: transglutaminaseTgpA domain-containing protein [Pirellulales bacterium]